MPPPGRRQVSARGAAPRSQLDDDSGMATRDKHEARPEQFTGLREFGRDAPGVPDKDEAKPTGRILTLD
jgi:hypothetical protein